MKSMLKQYSILCSLFGLQISSSWLMAIRAQNKQIKVHPHERGKQVHYKFYIHCSVHHRSIFSAILLEFLIKSPLYPCRNSKEASYHFCVKELLSVPTAVRRHLDYFSVLCSYQIFEYSMTTTFHVAL
jgi:hypothetical protein